MVNKDMKRCSMSLVVRKTQIGSSVNHHYIPKLEQLKSFQSTVSSVGKDVEKLKPLFIADGNVKLGIHFGKEFGNLFKNLNINLPLTQKFHSWESSQEK